MLTGDQILARLEDAGIRKAQIAKTLGLPDSRVAEIYGGRRLLKLDEAVKLVEVYKLDEDNGGAITPLPLPIARLIVQFVATELGVKLAADSPQLAELAADIRAFALFVSDRRVRDSVQAAEGFLQGIQSRRTDEETSQRPRRLPPVR